MNAGAAKTVISSQDWHMAWSGAILGETALPPSKEQPEMTTPVKPAPVKPGPAGKAPEPDRNETTTAPGAQKTPEAAEVKPGRKTGQKAKEYDFTGLTLDLLASPMVVTEELSKKAAPARARDERQLKIDAVVKHLHNQWIGKDKPSAWAEMPKGAYPTDPKAVEGLKYLIDRAASFHGVAVRYGKPVRDAQGREIVTFAVRDRRERPAKTDDDADTEG